MKKTMGSEIINFHYVFSDCFIRQNGHVVLLCCCCCTSLIKHIQKEENVFKENVTFQADGTWGVSQILLFLQRSWENMDWRGEKRRNKGYTSHSQARYFYFSLQEGLLGILSSLCRWAGFTSCCLSLSKSFLVISRYCTQPTQVV